MVDNIITQLLRIIDAHAAVTNDLSSETSVMCRVIIIIIIIISLIRTNAASTI